MSANTNIFIYRISLECEYFSAYQLTEQQVKSLRTGSSSISGVIPDDGKVFSIAKYIRGPSRRYNYETFYEPMSGAAKSPKKLKRHLQLVAKRYREKGIVSEAEVDHFLKAEAEFNPLRMQYAVFTDRQTKETKGIIRVYHGSPHTQDFTLPTHDDSYRLPLEKEFPNLKIPEREKDGKNAFLVELGRLAGDSDIDNTLSAAFNRAGAILYYSYSVAGKYPNNPIIYVEATDKGAKVYQQGRRTKWSAASGGGDQGSGGRSSGVKKI